MCYLPAARRNIDDDGAAVAAAYGTGITLEPDQGRTSVIGPYANILRPRARPSRGLKRMGWVRAVGLMVTEP